MSAILRQLIGRQGDARALVSAIAEALGAPVAIEDAEGRLLYGDASTDGHSTRFPVTHERADLGWVAGPAQAKTVAALLGGQSPATPLFANGAGANASREHRIGHLRRGLVTAEAAQVINPKSRHPGVAPPARARSDDCDYIMLQLWSQPEDKIP